MKKVLIVALMILMLFPMCSVYATTEPQDYNMEETQLEILEKTEESTTEIEELSEKYGSDTYGLTAYILKKIRVYSIPFCFVGIAIGALLQYAIGTRRLDMKQKGFGLIIIFITLLLVAQVLPLIFAIVVKGWGG